MIPNEIVRRRFLTGGVAGVGDSGAYVMTRFQQDSKVHVTAVCDVYSEHIDRARQKAPECRVCS